VIVLVLMGASALAKPPARPLPTIDTVIRKAAVPITHGFPGDYVFATCEEGETLTGGGFAVDGTGAIIIHSLPSPNVAETWAVRGYLEAGVAGPVNLTGWALCATLSK